MEDSQILSLYFARSEQAIAETDRKYGGYCYHIAYNILTNSQDAEESVSDTYLAAWNAIPSKRPAALAAFLGKITRFLSISRWRKRGAEKRGGGEFPLALDELQNCVSGEPSPEQHYLSKEAVAALNICLAALPESQRKVFLRRYWYLDSVADIAAKYGFSESQVTAMLHRTRETLRTHLKKEGLL